MFIKIPVCKSGTKDIIEVSINSDYIVSIMTDPDNAKGSTILMANEVEADSPMSFKELHDLLYPIGRGAR